MSPLWFVAVSVCRRFGSFKMDVAVMVCRRFGLSPFWFFAVSASHRFDSPPSKGSGHFVSDLILLKAEAL